MITHVWSVLCSLSLIDQESKNVSMFNVIEQISIPEPPSEPEEEHVLSIPITFEVVSLWVRADVDQPSRGYARVVLRFPSQGDMEPFGDLEVNLTGRYQRSRTRHRIGGFPVPEAGRYWFHVQFRYEGEDEWQEVARIPLQVSFMPPDEGEEVGNA